MAGQEQHRAVQARAARAVSQARRAAGHRGRDRGGGSPWLEDNQWVLDMAAKDKIMVGTVGDLEPGKPEFAGQLERFHRNPLFRGIRYGNLWDRNLAHEAGEARVHRGLEAAGAGGPGTGYRESRLRH